MSQMNRRQFNKTLIAVSGVSAGASLGLLPLTSHAAWPAEAFDAESVADVMNALYGVSDAEASDAITVKGPDIAENGAVVPISVETSIENADSIALLVANNPSPLATTFELLVPGPTKVGTRIKMGETSELVALVRAGGKVYTANSQEIKVTIGGCGG